MMHKIEWLSKIHPEIKKSGIEEEYGKNSLKTSAKETQTSQVQWRSEPVETRPSVEDIAAKIRANDGLDNINKNANRYWPKEIYKRVSEATGTLKTADGEETVTYGLLDNTEFAAGGLGAALRA